VNIDGHAKKPIKLSEPWASRDTQHGLSGRGFAEGLYLLMEFGLPIIVGPLSTRQRMT